MVGGEAVDLGRHLGDHRQPALRHRRRLCARRREFPGKALLNGLVHLPLILPPVVTGYLLLLTFGRRGPVGEFFETLARRRLFLPLDRGRGWPAPIMAFPLMVRAIRLSVEAVDTRLEDAAGTLGAGPLWVFATVTLPLILPGIIAGMILAFAKAVGEFGATITFVSNIPGQTQTLPSAIYTFTQVPDGRRRRDALDAGGHRHRHGRPARLRVFRAKGEEADGRAMSISVAISQTLGAFQLDAGFESAGRLTALFGPSGSGKTSVINAIGRADTADRGENRGRRPPCWSTRPPGSSSPRTRRRIGLRLPGRPRLFPHLSVAQNLRYGRFFTPQSERYADFDGIVDLLGIVHLLERMPGQLSGGEKQRVAIGRALIASPRLILMDEPLARLTRPARAEILPYIERLRDETGVPIVYVSHAIGEVTRLATRHRRDVAGARDCVRNRRARSCRTPKPFAPWACARSAPACRLSSRRRRMKD